jgi:hypothetical protein|tara:strand:- start:287 stop:457 length:171 start_codon:yes stop_codon:yes gene_type:complete
MVDKDTSKSAPKTPTARDLRLNAALKANLGRRKTQTRARSAASDDGVDNKQAKDES